MARKGGVGESRGGGTVGKVGGGGKLLPGALPERVRRLEDEAGQHYKPCLYNIAIRNLRLQEGETVST